MRGLNKVTLIGNLGKDPEFKYVEGNIALAKFSLATTETYKDKNGNFVPQTEWHNIVVWRNLAEFADKFLKKGHLIYIEGKIKTRSWEDSNNIKKFSTEIVAENLLILEKRSENKSDESGSGFDDILNSSSNDDDMLPF